MDSFVDSGRRESPEFDQQVALRLAAGLADQFALLYGEQPLDPRVDAVGGFIGFSFEGALTRTDQVLLETERGAELREFRERFLNVIGPQLNSVVETIAGGTVTFSFPAFDPGSRTTNMFFAVDLMDATAEQRRAILNWSDQVRRNARTLRSEQKRAREVHHELKRQVHQRVAEHHQRRSDDR